MDQKQLGILLIGISVIMVGLTQLIFKHRFNYHGAIPFNLSDFTPYFLNLTKDWLVWVAGIGLIVSAGFWYAAISRVPLSIAFPFAAMSYPLIFITSIIFLGESFSYAKLIANILIICGVVLIGVVSS